MALVFATSAFGDAADPVLEVQGAVPNATHAQIINTDAQGNFTVQVWGGSWVGDPSGTTVGQPGEVKEIGWQWTTHGSDCTTDRAGVGVAVGWNDPSGNIVKSPYEVGILAGSPAAFLNGGADNRIHPTPPLVDRTGVAGYGTPLNGTPSMVVSAPFNDPAPFTDSSVFKQWRGGCGVYGQHNNVALPNGTTKSGKWNTGVWGPFTHTYPASHTGPVNICPVMYDVHGGDINAGPSGAKEITAGGTGHDGDNSIESNGTTPAGNGCKITTVVRLRTQAVGPPNAPVKVGTPISDRAFLNGTSPQGSVTFNLYKRQAGDTAPTCDPAHLVSGPDTQTIMNPTNSNTPFVDSASVPTAGLGAGTYYWVASYSGDANNQPATGVCGETGEISVVEPQGPSISTDLVNDYIPVGTSSGDTAQLSGATANAGGTVTYNVYAGPNCSGSVLFSKTVTVTNGSVPPSGNLGPFNSAGTYQWQAVYSGDANNAGASSPCGSEAMAVVDLKITKTADKPSVEVGSQVGFTITVTGSGPATDVALNDPLPSGPAANQLDWSVDNISGDVVPACSVSGAVGNETLKCDPVTLGGGTRGATAQSYSVHIVSSTDANGPGFTVSNTATASASNHSSVNASANVEVVDLDIDKRADSQSVQVGDPIGFKITVSGSGPAKGVTLNDQLPAGPAGNPVNWTLDGNATASPAGSPVPTCQINGAVGSQVLTCSAVNLGTGALSATPQGYIVHVVATTSANGTGFTIVNAATASATNHTPVTDDDNTGGRHDNTIEVVDLRIKKTADATPVDSGNPIGFKINVSGSGPAKGVTLNDPLPGGVAGNRTDWQLASVTANPAGSPVPSCSVNGVAGAQTLTCNAVTLGTGAKFDVAQGYEVHIVSATTAGGAAFTADNTATASATNHTPVQDRAIIDVVSANLAIVKKADASQVETGAQIGFTIKVTAGGPAKGVELNDDLPAGPSGNTLNWTLSGAPTGSVSPACSITGAVGSQKLHCNAIDMGGPGTTDTYTVHIVSPTAANGPAFTITNVAVASATNHPPVDDHDTIQVHHPVIAIDKTGPATGEAGQKIGYVLTVTNPGQESFAESTVNVQDALCVSSGGDAVKLIGKGGDASPSSLDPGDVWTYSCSVQTKVGDTVVNNTATVTGCDGLGKCVNDDDDAQTTLTQPTQLLLPERATPGAARLSGPTGCAAKAFNAKVRGAKIATVTFVLDGKIVKKVKNTKNAALIQYRIDPKKMRIGVHRLVVNVTFASGSGTKPKTLRLSFQRCGKKLAAPRFTG